MDQTLTVGPDPAQVQGWVGLQPVALVLADPPHVQGEVGVGGVQEVGVVRWETAGQLCTGSLEGRNKTKLSSMFLLTIM